jgi:hypothetical protein
LSATTIPQMYFSAMLPGPIHIHSTWITFFYILGMS